jgi:hypothetical protein
VTSPLPNVPPGGLSLRPLTGAFARPFSWSLDARAHIPFCPDRFDEDAGAMAAAINAMQQRLDSFAAEYAGIQLNLANFLTIQQAAAILPTHTYGPDPHVNAKLGDVWIDSATDREFLFIGHVWRDQTILVIDRVASRVTFFEQEDPPLTPTAGDEWFKPSENRRHVFEGGAWIEDN